MHNLQKVTYKLIKASEEPFESEFYHIIVSLSLKHWLSVNIIVTGGTFALIKQLTRNSVIVNLGATPIKR